MSSEIDHHIFNSDTPMNVHKIVPHKNVHSENAPSCEANNVVIDYSPRYEETTNKIDKTDSENNSAGSNMSSLAFVSPIPIYPPTRTITPVAEKFRVRDVLGKFPCFS